MAKRKRIVILLPSGMTVRNILHTNVTQLLLEDNNVEILCCVDNPQRYNNLFKGKRIRFISFAKKRSTSLSNILLTIVRRRTGLVNENKTTRILRDGPFDQRASINTDYFPAYPFPRSKILLRLFSFLLENLYFPKKEIRKMFDNYKPDLVLATHVVSKFEYDYLRVAKRDGIKIFGMVKSFDNLTSKGVIPLKLDYLIAWNEIIKKELMDMYNYPAENIFVTGIPQFDAYKETPKVSKEDYFERINLSHKKSTILFATNSEIIGIDDVEIVKLLSKNLEDLNAQLIVRIHPTDSIKRYGDLKLKDVHFDNAGIDNGTNSDDRVSSRSFISNLRDQLYFCDVVINTCSTMSLDAIAINKPVINIFFDFIKRDYNQSIIRYYDLLHYKPIMDSKSTCLARSRDELIRLLKDCIKNPEMMTKNRRSVIKQMLNGNNGDSAVNISKAILQTLGLH